MSRSLRLLVLEDSEADATLLRDLLAAEGGYRVDSERVDSMEGLRRALDRGGWDFIISDNSMPGFDALQALAIIKEQPLDIPVIILSGSIDEEAAVAAMRAGASDFIMKDRTARLLPAIERELREAESRRKARQMEDQFRQAQKMEAVGRLAGGVAHDFNNLLTAILGNCGFLLDSLPPEDSRRKDVEGIAAAGERAAALTRQLLAFSRRQVFELRVVDLNAVVANMERLLRRLIGEDIELLTAPGRGLGRIKADPGQLEQVIANLAVNARDAMPEGGRLTLATEDVRLGADWSEGAFAVAPGPYVMLSVADTGQGMDEATLAHIFEPFFTTKEPGRWTGLGLSTVYGIVKQSAGYIRAASAPGKGTTFRICFPRVEEAAEPAPEAAKPRALEGSETVLLVEDDGRVRELARRILARYGYRVLEAPGPEAALRIACELGGALDLLVSDVVMPGMSGGDLARELLHLRPGLKVLYLSGYTDDVVVQKGVLKPGIQYLAKPFTPEALVRKAREALDGGGSA